MNRSLPRNPLIALAALLIFAMSVGAASEGAEPKWHEVKPADFKVELAVDGVFEAVKTHEVKVKLDQWTQLEVAQGVEQGRHVSKGDVLIRFDTQDIDKKIDDTQKAREQAAIALADAEADLAAAEVTVPLDLAEAERSYTRGKEKFERWKKHSRDEFVTKMTNVFENARFSLSYQQAELDQLRKMYAEDSITEDSEEIVLERQERSVKLAKDALAAATTDHDYTMNVNLPMIDQQIDAEWATAQATWKKVQQTLPRSLESKRLAVDKLRRDRAESDKNFAELKADREKMTVIAPASGIVYYGSVARGKWSGAEAIATAMEPGGSIKPDSPIVTIVEPRPLRFRAGVNESQLRKAVAGADVRIVPAVDANLTLTGTVESVAALPLGATWDTIISVDVPEAATHLVAGMTGKATVVSFHAPDAITVPTAALKTGDDGKPYVEVRGEDGAPVKRVVSAGWRDDKRIQITDGLAAGEQVKVGDAEAKPADKPAEDKPAQDKQ